MATIWFLLMPYCLWVNVALLVLLCATVNMFSPGFDFIRITRIRLLRRVCQCSRDKRVHAHTQRPLKSNPFSCQKSGHHQLTFYRRDTMGKSTASALAQRHHWFTKNKCHELKSEVGQRRRKDPQQKRQQNANANSKQKTMLSTTKTYPCAKKNCAPRVQEEKKLHRNQLCAKGTL